MTSDVEALKERYESALLEKTSEPDPSTGYFDFRMHLGPLHRGLKVARGGAAYQMVRREISEERWTAEPGGRSSDGFAFRLGEDRSLVVLNEGTIMYHRLLGNAVIGGLRPVPFQELFLDTFVLLRFAERAYPQLADGVSILDVRVSLVNIFKRDLDLPPSGDSFPPRRAESNNLGVWFSQPVTFRLDQDDPIRVTRAIFSDLLWVMGYEQFEDYIGRWGSRHERPAPLITADELVPLAGMVSEYKYDVAFSFAGSERQLAQALAQLVKDEGFRVFYDRDEAASLWGKDLFEELDSVYRKDSRYCVMFISKAYAERMWTTHERRAALVRAGEEKGQDYILPVLVERADIPGMPPTRAYLSLDEYSIEEIGEILVAKLRG
jgi:hypothetical protein